MEFHIGTGSCCMQIVSKAYHCLAAVNSANIEELQCWISWFHARPYVFVF